MQENQRNTKQKPKQSQKRLYGSEIFRKGGFWDKVLLFRSHPACVSLWAAWLRLALGGRGLKQLHHHEAIREGRVSWAPLQPRATHLFHFNSPHWATNVDDKQDVFGNWVHVLRSKEVDKISIKYLKNRTCVSRTITSVWHVGGWGSGDWQGSRDHGEQEAWWP